MIKAAIAIAGASALAVFLAMRVQGAELEVNEATAMLAACAGCHGSQGEGIEARSAPRLAGLQPQYLARQLSAYASGLRGSAKGDQFGPQMAVIAKTLKPADVAAAAAHYGQMNEVKPFRTIAGNPANGKRLFESCAACHGPSGEGQNELNAPRIAGQSEWYVLRSLFLYRAGTRGNDPADAAGQAMKAAADALGNEQDVLDVAAYASGLGQ